MNDTITKAFIFTLGAAIGSAVTWKLLKDKYERISAEEIFERRDNNKTEVEEVDDVDEPDESDESNEDTQERTAYHNILSRQNYANISEDVEEENMDDICKPYVISPEEYDEYCDEGWDAVGLTYWVDGALTCDEDDEPVNDVELIIGDEALEKLKNRDIEDDTLYVRNEEMKSDYEIMFSARRYSDFLKMNS